MGLRGTGSHHLSLSGVQVPAEHLAAPFFEAPCHDGPLWRIPLVTQAAMFLGAVPLGIARRALDEFAAIAATKTRGPGTQRIGHDAAVQCQLTQAEGALASARSFLFDTSPGSGAQRAGETSRALSNEPSPSSPRPRRSGLVWTLSTGCSGWPAPKQT